MDAHTLLPPIIRFYRTRHRMPSLRELATLYGFRSQNAAAKVVTKLLTAGVVAKDRTGRLLPTRSFASLRVLGTVEAGFPSPAEEELAIRWTSRSSSFGTKKPPTCSKSPGIP